MANKHAHTIHSHQHHIGWDNSNAPALTITPGTTVAFETVDASGAQLSPKSTVDDIAIWNGVYADPSNNAVPIRSVGDIHEAKANGNVGILLNVQNSICIGTDVDNIDFFYNLGLRVVQLTYNLQNFMASGCLEDPKKNLSNFGIQAIGRMNEIGMLVDTGHTGDGSIKHAVDVSEKPI